MKRFENFARRGRLQEALQPLINEYCRGKYKFSNSLFREMKDLDFDAFKKLWHSIEEDEKNWEKMFQALDTGGDGIVSSADLKDWFAFDYVMNSDERLWDFIRKIDISCNKEETGKITRKMMSHVVKHLGAIVNLEDWFEYDDEYSYEDFAVLFRLDSEIQFFTTFIL